MTPDFGLHGRACLVTGAARGIGRAIALALAEAGADVALGLRDSSTGGEVVDEIAATGRAVLPLQMDVTDLDQVTEAVEAVVRRFGRLDVLVNNAGIGPPETPAEDVGVRDFDDTVALNLKGTFFASQAAGRVMIEQGSGRIVNLSSQAGFVALPGEAVYCMTKAAISHLTKCLAVEWGDYGITVNAVAPTFIATPGTEPALADPAFRADVEERIAALHRIGTPDDVTGAVVFLASPAASLITGQTLLVDGGRIAALRGTEPADHTPEEWIGAANTTFDGSRGLSRLPDGTLVRDALAADPEGFLGPAHTARFGTDPALLVKLLDAGQRLPVHFHPDGAFAERALGLRHGKTEAWLIVEADPGASVWVGFDREIDMN